MLWIYRGTCALELADDTFCNDYNMLSRHLNYAVPADVIIRRVRKAVAAWNADRAQMRTPSQ